MKRKALAARATSPEKLAMRFEPDVLVSYAHLADCRPILNLQPEKRLMLAVLEDAFYCLQKFPLARNSRGKKTFHEAEIWFWSDQQDWPYSFTNVCDALGFDANYIRCGLLRWWSSTGKPVAPSSTPVGWNPEQEPGHGRGSSRRVEKRVGSEG